MKQLSLLGDTLLSLGAYALAIPAALLPRRWWPWLHTWVPAEAAVIPSAIATFLLAMLVGIPAFLRFGDQNRDFGPLIFFLFLSTPTGMAVAYLTLTAQFRGAAAVLGDKHGDPVLQVIDYLVHRQATKQRVQAARDLRAKLEGPEVADRLLSGVAAGFPDAGYVVVSSRQKPGWSAGTFIETGDRWYRIGTPVQRDTPNGLRTMYPLFEPTELEVIRRAVRYDLPLRGIGD